MKRRVVLGIVGAAAALLLAGALVWWLLASRGGSPEDSARTYLTALAEGDGEAALAQLAAVPEAPDLAAVLSAADERIAAPEVTITAQDDVSARAEATFTLGGRERAAAFSLVHDGERWRVADDALGTVRLSTTAGDTVRVGDVLVPVGDAAMLPGTYTVSAAPADLVVGEVSVDVLPGGSVEAAVAASLSPDASALAQSQLDAYAEACAQPADAVPENCGIAVPWGADLAELRGIVFRIETLPALAIAEDGLTFVADGGVLVATARGTTHAGAPGTVTYRTDDWTLRGSVAVTGGSLVLAVR